MIKMDLLSTILAMGGTSFIIGFLIGLFIKALSKVLAVIAGAFLLGVTLLASYGIIIVNYSALAAAINTLFSYLGGLALTTTAAPLFLGLATGWAIAPRRSRKDVESWV